MHIFNKSTLNLNIFNNIPLLPYLRGHGTDNKTDNK